MYQVTIKRVKYIAHQFWLSKEVRQSCPDERLHPSPRDMMVDSESIVQGGVGLPLHGFVKVVLQHFNVVPFQFTPHCFCIIVVFFIPFMEVGIGELNVDEFTYVYGIKALAHHEGFWYMTKQGATEKGIIGLYDNMGHWKDHFNFGLLLVYLLSKLFSCPRFISQSNGRYSSSLDQVARGGVPQGSGSLLPTQPLPAYQLICPPRLTGTTAVPTPPSGQSVKVSGEQIHSSQDSSCPAPRKDKGKQPLEDQQQRKRKQVVEMDSEGTVEAPEGGFIANTRRVERRERYVSFNPIEDYQGRVENIKGYFSNLPRHLCIPYNR